MNVKFIVNPTSGRQIVQQNVDGVTEQLIQEGLWKNVDVFYTHARNTGFQEALQLTAGEYDLVVAVGGDGTIHEVVNGVLKGGCNIPIAVMPAGTSGIICRSRMILTAIVRWSAMARLRQLT